MEIIKNFDMALEVYNKILTIDPKNKDTKYHKGIRQLNDSAYIIPNEPKPKSYLNMG